MAAWVKPVLQSPRSPAYSRSRLPAKTGVRALKNIEPQRTPGTGLAAAATAVIALAIAVLMLVPLPLGPVGILPDKLAHLLAFAALAFPMSLVRARFAVFVFVGVIAYGAGIELLQPFFGRAGEWSDFVMDVAGALIGAAGGAAGGRAWRR